MTTLTSILNLRNSEAMQSRVTQVESFLKSLNRDWKPEWMFPIAIINVSNDNDDCGWVRNHTSTHLKPGGNVKLHNVEVPSEIVINALKGLNIKTRDDLPKIDEAIGKAVNNVVSWIDGIQAVQVVVSATKTSCVDNNVSPMDALISQLVGMETADIMAVLAAANSARGGLLRGARCDELTTFIHSMTGNTRLYVQQEEAAAHADDINS